MIELALISLQAMQKLKEGYPVLAMDPKLRRNPASTMAVEKVLKLARLCLAPQRQSRPSMRKCGEVLWGIRKDFRDRACPPPSSTSHHSANYPRREANNGDSSFEIADEDKYTFNSA